MAREGNPAWDTPFRERRIWPRSDLIREAPAYALYFRPQEQDKIASGLLGAQALAKRIMPSFQ